MKHTYFLIVFCLFSMNVHGMESSSCLLDILSVNMISKVTVGLDLVSTSSFLRTCKQLYCGSKQLPQEVGVPCGVDRLLQQSAEKCTSLSAIEYSTVFGHCGENNKTSLLQFLITHESDDNKSLRMRLLDAFHCDQSCYNDVECNRKAYADSVENNKDNVDLYSAVDNNNFIVVHAFLKQGVSIETQDEDADTPLIVASTHGYTELVKLLLACGALVNSTGFCGATALVCAVCNGNVDTVKVLLENGADKRMCVEHDDFFQWINKKATYSREILEILNKHR